MRETDTEMLILPMHLYKASLEPLEEKQMMCVIWAR